MNKTNIPDNIPDNIFNIFNSKTIEEAIIKVNNEVKINKSCFIDSEDSESDISDLESESSEEEYEVVKENIKVTLNKDGFYELI